MNLPFIPFLSLGGINMAKNQMTMREVVSQLRSQGHNITYYERKDGGILIRSIDGQMFTGATGNLYARAMTGTTLSSKRAAQISQITWTGKRAKSQISDREVKKKLENVQKKWRKAFPRVDGKVPSVGRKTAKKTKWNLEHKGKEETMRLLNEAERYATGLAYNKNIDYLLQMLKDYIDKIGKLGDASSKEVLSKLYDDIAESRVLFKEENILATYEKLYLLNKGVPAEEVARQVRDLLNLN